MARVNTENLESWRSKLNASGLPVFSRTVRDIRNVSTSRLSSAQDLSDVIGNDASMTARIIQIANSSLFNLQNRDIDTINSAVVLVGFDAVRDLVISVSVIEEMLKGRQHARVGQHMARAFHAAAQARSFARICGDKTEEVFVGALLKDVGEMAFWSRSEREAMAIEAKLVNGITPPQAEREVLGFELADLSKTLAEDWHLGDLVAHVLDGRHEDDPMVRHVELAHELAEVLDAHDWGSGEVQGMVQKLAKHLSLKPRDVEDLVCANLDAAAAIASGFGVTKIEDSLPSLPNEVIKADESTDVANFAQAEQASESSEPGPAPSAFQGDVLLQLLADIADGIEAGASRNTLMQKLVEAVLPALGFTHAYFALFSPDRTKLHIKYAAGDRPAAALSTQTCSPDDDELLNQALQETHVVSFASSQADGIWHFGGAGATVAVRLAGKSVGVFYCEQAAANSIQEQQVKGFKQLGFQVGMILAQAAP